MVAREGNAALDEAGATDAGAGGQPYTNARTTQQAVRQSEINDPLSQPTSSLRHFTESTSTVTFSRIRETIPSTHLLDCIARLLPIGKWRRNVDILQQYLNYIFTIQRQTLSGRQKRPFTALPIQSAATSPPLLRRSYPNSIV